MVALRRSFGLALLVSLLCSVSSVGFAQDAASDQAKGMLDKGVSQFKAFEFKASKETLLKVDRSKLADADQKALDDYLVKVDPAIRENAAAMEAFNAGEKALKNNELDKAKENFALASQSQYLPDPMKKAARSQLALVEDRVKLSAAAAATPAPKAAVATSTPAPAPAPAVAAKTADPAPAAAPVAKAAPAPATTGEPNILTRVQFANRVAKQESDIAFQKGLTLSRERATGADTLAAFDGATDAARVALNTLETNKMYYTADEYREKLAQANDQINWVANKRQEWQSQQVEKQREQITTAANQAAIKTRVERQTKIDQLIRRANTLIRERDFKGALDISEQILKLDPTNTWANNNQMMLKQYDILKRERSAVDTRNYEEQKQMVELRETEIPWNLLVRYPENWRELTASRERFGASTVAESESDRAVNQKLRSKIPKVDFNDIEFQNVVNFLRDISAANIDVNWLALTAAGIDKTTKVTVKLSDVTFEKALRVILQNVGGVTPLSFVVDGGVITISTKEDLSKKTITRVYDISDLIVRVPNFTGPRIDISNIGCNSGSNGGGGSGGGLFSNSSGNNNGGNEDNIPTKQEIITNIVNMIKSTVEPESWRPEGTVGSLQEMQGQLIVTQTADAHAALSALINQLREARALQIAIEARFISVSNGFLESIGVDIDAYFNIGSRLGSGSTVDPWTGAVVPTKTGTSGWGTNPPGNNNLTPIPVNQNSTSWTNMLNQAGATNSLSDLSNQSMTVAGTFLDDIQVDFLIQATQADANSRTLTAPRVTIFNGQRAYVTVATQQAYIASFEPVVSDNAVSGRPEVGYVPSGSVLDVEGTVSADRRYVTLTLRPQVSKLLGIQTIYFGGNTGVSNNTTTGTGIIQLPNIVVQEVQTTVSVPDGGTLLIGGQKLATQEEREQGVPILSKIPVINRAFTNRGMIRDEQTLLILVKPKIIIQREEEEKAFPPQ